MSYHTKFGTNRFSRLSLLKINEHTDTDKHTFYKSNIYRHRRWYTYDKNDDDDDDDDMDDDDDNDDDDDDDDDDDNAVPVE